MYVGNITRIPLGNEVVYEPHGEGGMTYANGEQKKGRWENGNLKNRDEHSGMAMVILLINAVVIMVVVYIIILLVSLFIPLKKKMDLNKIL